jgi:hypothetical protein
MDLYAELFSQLLVIGLFTYTIWRLITQPMSTSTSDPLHEGLGEFRGQFDKLFAEIASDLRGGPRRAPLSDGERHAACFAGDLHGGNSDSDPIEIDERWSHLSGNAATFESGTADDHASQFASMSDDDIHSHHCSNPASGLPIFENTTLDSGGSPMGFDLNTLHHD